jgi:HNH endonuclease
MKTILTSERLRQLLKYDPATGYFTRVMPLRGCRTGSIAGTRGNHGYITICVDKRLYLAHRLAWFYMTGEWPTHQIDHCDMNKTNNIWRNLREATPSQNKANKTKQPTNTSGMKGVSWHKQNNVWRATISAYGTQYHLGCFSDPKEDHDAYFSAAQKFFGEFART